MPLRDVVRAHLLLLRAAERTAIAHYRRTRVRRRPPAHVDFASFIVEVRRVLRERERDLWAALAREHGATVEEVVRLADLDRDSPACERQTD